VLERHFFFQVQIKVFYRYREEPGSLDKAIEACRQQIALAPEAAAAFRARSAGDPTLPSHLGYRQLAIILRKRGRNQEVIDLCTKAARQGWRGDWSERIEQCKQRLAKASRKARPLLTSMESW
jgi:hypothetical protein